MILGILFLVGAAVLVGLAWRGLRRVADGSWVRASGTRIVVQTAPGEADPQLRLEAGGAVAVGPMAAIWAPRTPVSRALGNPEAASGRLGGAVAPGGWRALGLVDLTAPDAIGSGDAALDARIAESLGGSAILLAREDGAAPPILLHAVARGAEGSNGGIALTAARFGDLAARLGDPAGLAVDVVRRRIQREGWGGERAQRKRAG
ncbi:hypothetical protein [Roseomonas sp. CECT 9278]|uniref:hypothetical protein n=1 Tax=Roseomonas sp. CECT 9278 TaxID=2845823 RepID=UPI001E496593|nr:hypothetical protein [Roseomonas sp. CECT 9278]CAH0309846.1 hypothetical protein ROS9278_04885 [Roseomonas sp. CECT 9278]